MKCDQKIVDWSVEASWFVTGLWWPLTCLTQSPQAQKMLIAVLKKIWQLFFGNTYCSISAGFHLAFFGNHTTLPCVTQATEMLWHKPQGCHIDFKPVYFWQSLMKLAEMHFQQTSATGTEQTLITSSKQPYSNYKRLSMMNCHWFQHFYDMDNL